MIVKNGQATEWSTRGKIVFGKWQTYNKIRRIAPRFRYGTEPKGYGCHYIEDRGDKVYAVVHEISGYMSLTGGGRSTMREVMLYGILRECKKWLVDLITQCYEDSK